MKFNIISTKEILDFEKEIGHELVVTERNMAYNPLKASKYYVLFERGNVLEGSCLVGYHGNGSTIDEAIEDYCKQISGKKMVFNAYTNRTEIFVPKLIHTKLLNS